MNAFTLTEINIYPVKSLGGISLHNAVVQNKGLQYDRRWMLIDKNATAMTQRVYPEMALFKPSIENDVIWISYQKGEKVISSTSLDIDIASDNVIQAKVWNDVVEVIEPQPAISQWFSRHLGIACRLVAFPEDKPRRVDPLYSVNNESVSLADAYPFLIIGQSSLDDLNTKLADPVPMNRFRPNFVFAGERATPYLEDRWRELVIGKLRFVAVKKSDRCVLTTVNQATGEKGVEPLRTLSGYRKEGGKVYFGQNLVALDTGEVSVGDAVIPG